MSSKPLADHAHRQQALDISGSFIVQAPAGSGKTELLTLRFLKLLSVCEQPEQVLAITFTKKAANEMSKRIVDALEWATLCLAEQRAPNSALDQQRLEIAAQVLAQDKKYTWHLLENPARLRVQTIDSFCFYLASQLPVLSQLGGNPRVADDVTPCFVDAISNTLAQLESDQPVSEDIAALLAHLDNDIGKVERLLVSLLHKRDQWLSHILDIRSSFSDARTYLQQSLAELVTESLEEVHAGLQPVAGELVPLLNFAAGNLQRAGNALASDYEPHDSLPAPRFSDISQWRFLVETLLTKNAAAWRRTVDVRNGFPPGDKADKAEVARCKQHKADMLALLETLSAEDDLLAALDYLRILPDPALDAGAWQFLAALTRVLAHLSMELLLSFRKFRVIDYAQTSSAARTALGDEDNPTDLALALDHRIQHILVDEFQDTSQMQLDILQQITAGWEPGDGRTLFLVGDAMQSCYAFRNANVGIYLRVRARGLGNIALTPLTLETNFRSQARVVHWVNQVFTAAFPQHANFSRGAVPYTPSVARHEALPDQDVSVTLLTHDKAQQEYARQEEAARVVAHIQALQQQCPTQSIAVLVRARPHLNHIIPALRAAGIQWQSTDIDRLTTLPVITDLLSLTRALSNQADRLAWLAVLRAPWCGLAIDDLHAVSLHAGANSIYSALQDLSAIANLSAEARERLQCLYAVLQYAMQLRYRTSLRALVEECWRLLGGNLITQSTLELDSVARYLNLLSEHETGAGIPDIDQFADTVAASFVPNQADPAAASQPVIHLLTMHKAKGLEYDHVILPGLARLPMSDDKPLLQWHQRLNHAGVSRLYLATLSAAGSKEDNLYQLLRYEQQFKARLENTRLLYIAVTRARISVKLFATLARSSKGDVLPPPASLLHRIWRELRAQPALFEEIALADPPAAVAAPVTDYPSPTPIRRLVQPRRLAPAQAAALQVPADSTGQREQEAFSLKEEAAIGTLIHRSLEAIGRAGDYDMHAQRLESMRQHWRLQLRNLVTSEARLAASLQQVETAVLGTLQNPALQWLFQAQSQDDGHEVAISSKHAGQLRHYQIDRSLVDADGTRWIIDYKTAVPGPQQSEASFLTEQRALYAAQIQNYRALYEKLEQRPSKCALLFTALGKLVEID